MDPVTTAVPEELRALYESSAAVARQAALGRSPVAIMGANVPAEDVLARGGVPIYLAADPFQSTDAADRYIASETWRLRSLAEPALDGRLSGAALLVCARGTEWAYYTLKEIVRRGEGALVPPLHAHDFVPTLSEAADRYNSGRMQALRDALDRALGCASEQSLGEAAALVKHRRDLLLRLERLRGEGRVLGSAALTAIGATNAAHPDEYLQPLAAWISRLEEAAGAVQARRILLVSADPSDNLTLHEATERCGANIVAEDSWWGSRAAGSPLADGPIEAAIDERLRADLCGRELSPRTEREMWVRERMARGDLHAVIFHVPPYDLLFGWDYPGLKAHAEAQGLRTLLLPFSIRDEEGRRGVETACASFFGGESR